MHDKMSKKRESSSLLEDQIEYTKELLKVVKEDKRFPNLPAIKEQINLLEETIMDTEYEIEYSKDQDARIGHKTADTSFFGYSYDTRKNNNCCYNNYRRKTRWKRITSNCLKECKSGN